MKDRVADIKAHHTIESVLASNGVEVKGGKALCPFHEDNNPSLSIYDNGRKWKCFAGCGSGDVVELLAKFDGKTSAEYLRNGNGNIAQPKTKPLRPKREASNNGKPGTIVAVYPYHDANGNLDYEIRRDDKKEFWPYLPGANWPGLNGVVRVPYRLPEVIQSETVWIVEGEKDADTLASLGYTATSRAGGSSTWEPELTPWFKDKAIILCGDTDAPGQAYMKKVEAALLPVAKSIKRAVVLTPHKDITDFLEGLSDNNSKEDMRARVEALICDPWEEWFKARRFDVHNAPPKPIPVVTVAGQGLATAGNIIAILSQLKTGTTNWCGALMASTMNPKGDCLGIIGTNPYGLPLLHFDTEQSNYDHHQICVQMLRRAGLEEPPLWFNSYWLTQDPIKDRRRAVAEAMRRFAVGGKLWGVVIDGVGDLCIDLNDPAEAFGLVEELHQLAITYSCPVFCRLHENPGENKTGKSRGHLGSHLERKAETNLRLEKDADEVVTVYTERSRHCRIAKADGPRFRWDAAAGMHVSFEGVGDAKAEAKLEELSRLIGDVFADTGKPSFKHKDLVVAIVAHRECSERTAKTRIEEAMRAKLLRHHSSMGLYTREAI